MSSTWVVPGAPLPAGSGWRIWYSWPGGDFKPGEVEVSRGGQSVSTKAQSWEALPAVDKLDRRMGILTVELEEPAPGRSYDLSVPELGRVVRWRTMPTKVDQEVSFLMSSCFWLPNDKEGAYGAAVRDLTKLTDPCFKLLIGDQLYQDYPQNWFQPRSTFTLYADRYEQYWGNAAYQEVLQATPNFFVADDHEFWNDFPERQVQLPRTYTAALRKEGEDAARTLYRLYQGSANPGKTSYYRLEIDPVSIFVADTRSDRTHHDIPDPHFFTGEQWGALEAWVDELKGPGVLVLPQPLFQRDGDWKDHSLSNFRTDFGRLCGLLERSVANGHDVLILTGDIHNARYTVATVAGVPSPPNVHELVASPASRVGPYLKTDAKATPPPTKFSALHDGVPSTWTVVLPESDIVPSVDNNVASIALAPGTRNRVRFTLTIWRVRPYDSRSIWSRAIRRHQPQAPLAPIYEKEIELS